MELVFNFNADIGTIPTRSMILNKVSEEEL